MPTGMADELGGAVAIWHDIVPQGLAEFYAWHGEEHMPERVAIPGFRRGRRFIAIEAELGFFNLYETDSVTVVTGPDYKARLDNPTPRTLSAVRHFRHVARSLCTVATRHGTAQGGTVATLRYAITPGQEAVHRREMLERILPALAGQPGIASIQLLEADLDASGYANAEQKARGAANAVPPFVLVVEGWADQAAFVTLVKEALSEAVRAKAGLVPGSALDFYKHQVTTVP